MANYTENETLNYDNKKTAKYLLTVAFAIEIAVAILAVFIGWTIAQDGATAFSEVEGMPAIGAALASTFFLYVLIAMVELDRRYEIEYQLYQKY